MNFDQIERQANTIQQHNTNIIQQLQQVAQNIQGLNIDESQKMNLIYSLKELALSVRGLNQETTGLIQNAVNYIDHLEQTHPQYDQFQQRYPQQYQQPVARQNGGFWNTILQSAEMGAGFAIGEDIVDDIFRIF
ncbi:hypothetical protein [Alicyclobacillus fastidiosus]|uniref:Uncharacterized protein n=1 Tax=Alicyclobacillus fastidiosus TaxID=392011 RepID=A0ABV5ACD2_9BACL|nr:hypothetical protein [Alicyclobacillus fastidiosus]WEH11376.1 hypothetical protein PYS47_09260 [Alicyclobacillus fastidiosus]